MALERRGEKTYQGGRCPDSASFCTCYLSSPNSAAAADGFEVGFVYRYASSHFQISKSIIALARDNDAERKTKKGRQANSTPSAKQADL